MSIIKDLGKLLCNLAISLKLPLVNENGGLPYKYPYMTDGVYDLPESYFFCRHEFHGYLYTFKFRYKNVWVGFTLHDEKNSIMPHFESSASDQWWVGAINKDIHGAVIFLLMKSFIRQLKVTRVISQNFLKKVRGLVNKYGYSLAEDTFKKAEELLVLDILKYEYNLEVEYIRNNYSSSEGRPISFETFCKWNRRFVTI